MIASQFRQLRDFFRSQDFRHSLLITGGAFAALIVLAFAVGLIFPAVPAQVLTLFSQQMADAGVVSESGSISVPALLWNNLRAMVLSVLYGFIPFIYLPALSLGVNGLRHLPVQPHQPVCPQKHQGHNGSHAEKYRPRAGADGAAAAGGGSCGGSVCDARCDAVFSVKTGFCHSKYSTSL